MRRSCGKKESKITFSNVLKLFYNFPTEKRRFFTIFQPKNGGFLQFSNRKKADFDNFPTTLMIGNDGRLRHFRKIGILFS
jgi:hypothetical protein